MTSAADDLVQTICAALAAQGDASRAEVQQRYMKSAMPFLGVPVPVVRVTTRHAAGAVTDAAVLRESARGLWDAASHREHRYAALALFALAPVRGRLSLVPLVEHMVRTGSWWDITDEAAHRIAELLDAHPRETAALVRHWSTDDDMWMRRLAIIAQLGRRGRTDAGLLEEAIGHNLADPEFFIRKAIGWALRDYARTDPERVRAYCRAQPLSPLSRREALRRLKTEAAEAG